MIPGLKKVSKIVAHADSDGIIGALVCKEALGVDRIELVQYGEGLDNVHLEEGVLFVDISPPDGRVEEFLEAGAIVLDHHESRRDIVAKFGLRGVFGEDGECGATLVYDHVWSAVRDPSFKVDWLCELIAVWDTWKRQSPMWHRACCLNEIVLHKGLEFSIYDSREAQIEQGHLLFAAAQKRILATAENAKLELWGYIPVAWVPCDNASVSLVADQLIETKGVAMVVCLRIAPDGSVVCSLRGNGNVDVGTIAKHHGGGGRQNTAGYSTTGLSPVGVLEELKWSLKDIMASR
ncbi:MAG: DHHA1 domain-containing protein [Planctomycetota bacterium]|jgi:oligoribonuclease NrnB/cAMP/cGMP phosphodiesterase (DHH superfamily)